MNKLLYPIFIFRLSFLLFFFLIKIIFTLYPKIILLGFSLLLAISNSMIFINDKFSQKDNFKIRANNTKINFLKTEKSKLEKANKKQSTHQEILLNLSKIEEKLGNVNEAEKYLQKAKNQNPNSELFQN